MTKSPWMPGRRAVLTGAAAMAGLSLAPTLIGRARAATPGRISFGLSSYPPTLEPWKNAGTAASTVKLQMHRGLLSYDAAGTLQPELARAWEAEDPQTFRFDLRPEAKFHDGSPVTSADVKASFEAMMAEGSSAYLKVALSAAIASIETPDPHTVRMRLKAPSAPFAAIVASFYAFVVSAKSLAETPDAPVGCGPYRLTGGERGTSLEFEAFEGYYKPGLPKSKSLSMIVYKDENLRVAALEAGDIDIIEYVPWQAMEMIEANDQLRLDNTDGPFMYLVFNCTQGPFANAKVRDAVGFAIKREDVMAAAFFNRGAALTGMPVPPKSAFHNDTHASHWSYDPARARALLAEAGFGGGFSCTMLSTAQYGMHQDTAAVCQQHLAAVGINVTLNLPDWATRVDLGNKGQYDLAVMGTAGEYNDPDALASFVDGRRGASFVRSHGFNDDRINALQDAGAAEIDPVKRKAIYDDWQARCIETVPLVGINWRAQGYAMQKSVQGFANIPGFLTFYSGLMLEQASIA